MNYRERLKDKKRIVIKIGSSLPDPSGNRETESAKAGGSGQGTK